VPAIMERATTATRLMAKVTTVSETAAKTAVRTDTRTRIAD
jgi:hypothetical protein